MKRPCGMAANGLDDTSECRPRRDASIGVSIPFQHIVDGTWTTPNELRRQGDDSLLGMEIYRLKSRHPHLRCDKRRRTVDEARVVRREVSRRNK
jgi:hypothetical protein